MQPKSHNTIEPRPLGFADIHPALTPDEALVAAMKCLYCFDAPCTRACPTHIDIPRFIGQILHNDVIGSARTILDANIFGGSCARACPTQVLCEGACVDNTHLKSPVEIGRLQRFACDTAHDISPDFYAPAPDTGRRVAIVGAGPAGLTCAHELRKRGHKVTVFDAAELPGGLNTVGIAAYKITTDFALTEVDRIMRMGIDLRMQHAVDGPQLLKMVHDFDAVFLAIGLGHTAPLHIPGEDLVGAWESLDFINRLHTEPLDKIPVGKHVVVIGGGNTAIDVANAAVRLGAPMVTMIYRRDRTSMPAFEHEYELANASGVKLIWLTQPLEIIGGPRDRVSGLLVQRVQLSGDGRRGRLEPIPGTEYMISCDMVIKALGQEVRDALLKSIPGLECTPGGRVVVDRKTLATSVPKLFAGGDCMQGAGEEIVNAVEAGKTAARGIHELVAKR
jgi:glutamate synthase (NADPH/NADH) small chain